MSRKVTLSILAILLIFLLPITMVLAYPGRFNDFIGAGHANCHGGTALSTTGWIALNSSSGQNVTKGENFTITAQIFLFNEAKGLTVSVGFVSTRGNNNLFGFNPSKHDSVTLEGTSGNSTTLITFSVTAPSTTGNFTLVIDALNGGSGSGAETLKWATGTLNITVESAPKTPTNPMDLQTIIIIVAGSIGAALAVVAVILIKKRS